jgi:hypothetical protein
MGMIILDFGSGNTCKNDYKYIERMVDELKAADTGKHEVVIKWQLFTKAGDNIPLQVTRFDHAYDYAKQQGYQTTASVFDAESLDYLLRFDIPFVKIANRPDLYWLAGEVPRKIPVYLSCDAHQFSCFAWVNGDIPLACISEYPATMKQYENEFGAMLHWGRISDHTTDFTLYHKYKPETYECHYKLEDSTGLDAGDFARTPEQLAEIL